MKKFRFELIIAIFLILLTVVLYCVHIMIFHDLHHLIIYGLEDLAFLPLEVLIVTLILDRLLELRDRKERHSKINMIIGTFFTEIGNSIFHIMAEADQSRDNLIKHLSVAATWKDRDYKNAFVFLKSYSTDLTLDINQFEKIKKVLVANRGLLVNFMQNPVLLEHGSFTDLLLAVFHLTEELSYRNSFNDLPESDIKHLNLDVTRVYDRILGEWLKYLKHLRGNYPYLYSLSLRVNPLCREADVIVK